MALGQRLTNFFETELRDVLNQALSDNLPIAGTALAVLADEYAFDPLVTAIDGALGGVADPSNAAEVAAALNGLAFVTAVVDGDDVVISLTASETETINILDEAVSLGGSAVNLDARADLTGTLLAEIDLQFRYTPSDLPDGDTLVYEDKAGNEVTLSAALAADVAANASLGFLDIALVDNMAGDEATLLLELDIADLTPAGLNVTTTGSAALDLSLVASVADDLLPSIEFEFDAIWNPVMLTASPDVSFGEVAIDVGTLVRTITDVLDPLLEILFEDVIGDIINAITTPLPILDEGIRFIGLTALFDRIPEGGDDIINLLDIVGGYFQSEGLDDAYRALSAAAEAIGFLKQLKDLSDDGGKIVLGDFDVDAGGVASAFNIANIDGKTPLERIGELIEDQGVLTQALDAVAGLAIGGQIGSLSDSNLTDESGLKLPLFENPEQIIGILLPDLVGGAPVTLIEYDIPTLETRAQFGPYFFPIVGPLGVTMSGKVGASTDFRIGYDTTSLQTGNFFDGLFLGVDQLEEGVKLEGQEPDDLYEHEPFFWSYAGVSAGLGINLSVVKAGVEGGLVGSAGAFLNNTITQDETYDLTGLTDRARLTDVLGGCGFDPILGRLGAEIVASFTIDFFFVSKTWSVTVVEVTIADFSFGCAPNIDADLPEWGLAQLIDLDLRLNTGESFSQFRVINGTPTTQDQYKSEKYTILNAVDENGVAIDGALAVQWGDLRQDFVVNSDGEILADMGEKNDSVALAEDVQQALIASGGDGLDIFIGALGNDILRGDDGADRLFGNAGDDMLYGGDGDDLLVGGSGADVLDGGAGRDQVSYEDSDVAVRMEAIGFQGGNIIYGVTGGDAQGDILTSIEEITGTQFNDVLYGSFNADNALEGRDGNDVLVGFNGNDLLMGGIGADVMVGGGGKNATSYVTSLGGVRIDMLNGVGQGGDAQGDQLSDIQLIQGSYAYDTLRGTSAANTFYGYDGDDILEGRGGRDEIFGDRGNDIVFALADGDTLDGGSGNDLLSYENATFGVSVNLQTGDAFRTALPLFPGDDIVLRMLDPDGEGPEPAVETADSTFENLDGSNLDDNLIGDISGNTIRGLAGNDSILGGGDDVLIGGADADVLDGGTGLGDTADYSDAFAVNVNLTTGTGLDDDAEGDELFNIENLRGTVGVDLLRGNSQDNRIEVGLSRGSQNPLDVAGGFATGVDQAFGEGGRDTLVVDYSRWDTGLGMTGGFTGVTSGGFERLTADGTTALDRVAFEDFERLHVLGTIRDDTVTGGGDDDFFAMGGGDDSVNAGSGVDHVLLQEGDDSLLWRLPAPPSIILFDGTDVGTSIVGPGAIFFFDGGSGIDELSLDLREATDDIIIQGFDTGEEFNGVNFRTQAGGIAQNFEQLTFILTGSGDDQISQSGVSDNIFAAFDGQDILRPGLGADAVLGGRDFVEGEEIDAWRRDGGEFYPTILDFDAVFANSGDLLELDYSGISSGVTGMTERVSSGVNLTNLQFELDTNQGTYVDVDGDVALTFLEIERMDVTGSDFADRLTGSHDSYLQGRFAFDVPADGLRGDDVLRGRMGDDVLIGYSGDDTLRGGAGNDTLIGGDPSGDAASEGINLNSLVDPREVDILTGGTGADRFVLGVTWRDTIFSALESGALYNFGGGENYARITDFDASEGDILQLAKSSADYITVASPFDDSVLVVLLGPPGGANDLIAIVDGVGTLDLDAAYVDYVGPGNLGAGFSGADAFIPPIFVPPVFVDPGINLPATLGSFETLNSALVASPTDAAAVSAPLSTSSGEPIVSSPQITDDFSIGATQDVTLALDALDVGWVTQENNPAALIAALFSGGADGIDHSKDQLDLVGDGRAFGTFAGDPFGLVNGIVISTGDVDQIDEANEVDGGWTGATQRALEFSDVGTDAGRTVFRADLTGLGSDLNSLVLRDSGAGVGGSGGDVTGFDLDAVFLSRTRIDDIAGLDLNDDTVLEKLDVFDFTPAATYLNQGSQRTSPVLATDDANLRGTLNGFLVSSLATLGQFDSVNTVSGEVGFLSLGDGGSVGFDLTSPVRTDMPLYLYVVETGANESLEATITASDGRLEAPSDLSTDFGAVGAEDDQISMTYTFEALEEFVNGKVVFDFVFFSEELIEWAGSEFNDFVSISLNGVQLGALSDGAALSINTLRPAPISLGHPDFVWNPAVDSPAGAGPVADSFRGDGYTQTLSFEGALAAGPNTLKIEVADVRDGLMDSGLLIQGGSFRIIDEVDANVDFTAFGTTLIEGAAATAIPVTLSRDPTDTVTLTFTPNEDVDLGSGAGIAHVVTINPGDPLTFDLAAFAVQDFVIEGSELVVAQVAIASGDPDYDGLALAPLLLQIEDGAQGEDVLITLGDAPERFSRSDPTAWQDAWSDPAITLEWKADITDAAWSAVNLGTSSPGTFGGSGLWRGDLGVSGVSRPSEVQPQEIDGSEALRVVFSGIAVDQVSVDLVNFTTADGGIGADEAARFTFFDADDALIEDFIVSADQGVSHTFDGFAGAASMVVQAGAQIGGSFVNGALTGVDPLDSAASGFLVDTFIFEGFEIA